MIHRHFLVDASDEVEGHVGVLDDWVWVVGGVVNVQVEVTGIILALGDGGLAWLSSEAHGLDLVLEDGLDDAEVVVGVNDKVFECWSSSKLLDGHDSLINI